MQFAEILPWAAIVVSLLGVYRQWRRDKSSLLKEQAEARKIESDMGAMLDERANRWLEKQGSRIEKQDAMIDKQCALITVQEKRIEAQEYSLIAQKRRLDIQETRITELELRDVERANTARKLQQYIEYLLAGIRVLIKQVMNGRGEMPKFDPVGFDDFILTREVKNER